jgi:hypothetical protein
MNSHSLFIRYILKVCLILPQAAFRAPVQALFHTAQPSVVKKRKWGRCRRWYQPCLHTETVNYILPVQSYSLHPAVERSTQRTHLYEFVMRYRLLPCCGRSVGCYRPVVVLRLQSGDSPANVCWEQEPRSSLTAAIDTSILSWDQIVTSGLIQS